MIYSNIEFMVLWFLSWTFYSITTRQDFRRTILLVASQAFFLWAGIVDYIIFLAITWVCWYSTVLGIRHESWKKPAVFLGILILTFHLFYWKYATWLWASGLGLFHRTDALLMSQYVIPVGISFYTLQAIAYLIDFARNKAPLLTFFDFLLFKSFFPQLVAGPICRSHQLLPQLDTLGKTSVRDLGEGLLLFAIGFFKKIALADNLEPFANLVFSGPEKFDGLTLLVGALAFTAQIWCDFSGYTDMGRGIARTFGIRLPENFLSPYLAKSPGEFWQRWHITLSQWIRDYIYIPLGGSQGTRFRVFSVALLTMVISGLWHGAAWNFLLWGLYHGLLLVGERALKLTQRPKENSAGILANLAKGLSMFCLTILGWIIFRIQSIDDLTSFLGFWAYTPQSVESLNLGFTVTILLIVTVIHVLGYYNLQTKQYVFLSRFLRFFRLNDAILGIGSRTRALACMSFSVIILLVGLYFRSGPSSTSFIYFQF